MYPVGTSDREAKVEEAEVRREELRAELHKYGALSAEPNLEELCTRLDNFLQNRKLEDFLKKAGGLKHELSALVQVRVRRPMTDR